MLLLADSPYVTPATVPRGSNQLRHRLDLFGLTEVAHHGIDLASLESLASDMASTIFVVLKVLLH